MVRGRPLQQRRWAVVTAFQNGVTSPTAIARATGEDRKFVYRTLARWRETGGVGDRPRTGRPQRLAQTRVRQLLKTSRTRSTRRAAREVAREEAAPVSRMAVWRAAKRARLRFRVRPVKPLLTPSHMRERLRFALTPRPRGFWRRVVASDEKTFSLFTDVRGQWVEEGEEPRPRETRKWPGGLRVWAGSSWEGKTRLHFVPASMKGPAFVDFIKKKAGPDLLRLYPSPANPPVWLQDRDGSHTAKVVREYLATSRLTSIEDWPAHSPDLNWQENVWEMMAQRVRERNPRTLEGLRPVLQEAWDDIDIEEIRSCVRSMPDRLEAVVAAAGGHTRY
jgi:transposase